MYPFHGSRTDPGFVHPPNVLQVKILPSSVIGISACVLTLIKLTGKLYGLPKNFHSPTAAGISKGGDVGVDSPLPKSKFNTL